ncbi:MAG: hypothetical protein PHQ59_05275 [Candidatus Daviesbacteria bacterium]|nr:hypothetical protein [Candidatus Daviesbacteria bacterium]
MIENSLGYEASGDSSGSANETGFDDIFGKERKMITDDANSPTTLHSRVNDFCPRLPQIESVDPVEAAKIKAQMQREAAENQIKGMHPSRLSLFS